jgi:hypothetical protein
MKHFQTFLLVLFFSAGTCFGQYYENVKAGATEYFLSLASKNSSPELLLEQLQSSLNSIDTNKLNDWYKIDNIVFNKLITDLNNYESELKNISADSALYLFHLWYLQLSNTFYDYANPSFFGERPSFLEQRDKIILFSTSMSCYCTMEMCIKQAAEIMQFAKTNNLDYWIIDSYEHSELQIKFETLFAPSVILFDSHNQILTKIEYDDNMFPNLNNFYSQRE